MPFPGSASRGSRLPICPYPSRQRQGSVLSQSWFCDLELISCPFWAVLSHSIVKGSQRPYMSFLLLWVKVCVSFLSHSPTKTLASPRASQTNSKPLPHQRARAEFSLWVGPVFSQKAGALKSRGCPPHLHTEDSLCRVCVALIRSEVPSGQSLCVLPLWLPYPSL